MFTMDRHHRSARRVGIAGVAAVVVLVGAACTAGGATDDAAEVAADDTAEVADAGTEATVWDEAFIALYGFDDGELGDGVEEIDGVAPDFPDEFPLPEGEVVSSLAGDGVWDLIIETDEPEQAEQLAEAYGEVVPLDDEGTPGGGDGYFWQFLDDTYAVNLQMQPGPHPPPMVAVMVYER
ncbi:hypothetical protein ARHIZOSPH14_01530 [Agromyces rhizosphaerae]|uniref:Secreted protein n=1 Tax=Agromyces rhizosphaerae TaxID=88374 RepID=A0A9W6CTQ6_9MICO|nr:hypothetical protein [Agromyces rhizosphaerae]GLI25911.1 hypothetical protein ARHIZOSPH14_01530 [Agromyces rhizosphaerae]